MRAARTRVAAVAAVTVTEQKEALIRGHAIISFSSALGTWWVQLCQ